MLSNIRNDEEFELYKAQLRDITEALVKQQALDKDAQIGGLMLKNLEKLHTYLEKEIYKYSRIQKM